MRSVMAGLVVLLVCSAALAQSQPAPDQGGGQPGVESSEPEIRSTIDPPLPPADSGRAPIPSFQRGSGSRAGGPANELNTGDSRAREELPDGSVADAVTGRSLYHGNYCGVGQRGEGLPPTDELDAACMRHDACYDAAGHRSCACDRTLAREAARVANMTRLSRELRTRAANVVEAAGGMECQDP